MEFYDFGISSQTYPSSINTSYLTDSDIIFTLKMESVSKNTIFGLKMMVKSGLEKIFFKFLHAGDYFSLLHKSVQNHKCSDKNNHLPAWRDFKIIFSIPLFTIIFRPKMIFLGTDSILKVKMGKHITETDTTELENLSHNIIDIFIIET